MSTIKLLISALSYLFLEYIVSDSVADYNDICDVLCEKVSYCGTNLVGPGNTPRIIRGV